MASPYELPEYMGAGERLLGSLLEFYQESTAWLASQRPSAEWAKIADMLGPNMETPVDGLSNTGYNVVERNARDIVASLSNFRYSGMFKPTFDQSLYGRAHALTKLDRNWERVTHAHEAFRANLQNTVAFGTGYLFEDYDKNFHGAYGDIRLRAFAPQDVTFVQLPKDHDIQKAYMVIIKEEMGLNLARRVYGSQFGSMLIPDRQQASWIRRGLQAVQQFISPALRVAGTGAQEQRGAFPTVDIFHAYTMDFSCNETGAPLQMGARGTNWTYTVPSLGDPISIGKTNPATGSEWTRPALEDDCRMFPLRRYTIFSRTAVAYDGSSPWWHGAVPVARTRFNDWAWEALGKSLLGDVKTMQDGIVAMMRGIEDSIAARMNPPYLYDEQLTSEGFQNNFNPQKAGTRASANLNQGGDIVKFPVDPHTYDLGTWIPDWIKQQEQRINHQMGTPDLVAMAKAKQVPGQGTLEKLMEMAGPLVDDMVRSQEVPYQQLGEWRKAYYLQFYTYPRMVEDVGEDEIPEDVEYESEKLAPYKKDQYKPEMLLDRVEGESPASRQNRLKASIKDFRYWQEESSINERHRMTNKLALLQLKKSGVPIDRWTIYKAFQIENPGPEPEGTHNVMERVRAEQVMDLEHAQEVAQAQQQAGGGGPQKGRPPTNTAPPRLQSKDGGARSTIATSK